MQRRDFNTGTSFTDGPAKRWGRRIALFHHPIGRVCEEWWKEFGDQHSSPEWQAYVDDESRLAEEKALELKREHTNGGRFGMSKASGCTRAAGLKFLGEVPLRKSGSSLFTFNLGHTVEVKGIATLRAAGYRIEGQQEAVLIDPFMHSFSDGIMSLDQGNPNGTLDTILSVKSIGYKKSGKERGKFVRRGFPELPFEGVRKAQPSWYAQVQAEMWGSGLDRAMVFAVAKDTVQAMADDPYVGDGDGKGNGSLTFYGELIQFDEDFCTQHLLPVWETVWEAVGRGDPGPAFYLSADEPYYVELVQAATAYLPNAGLTGTFSPCGYCDMINSCTARLS